MPLSSGTLRLFKIVFAKSKFKKNFKLTFLKNPICFAGQYFYIESQLKFEDNCLRLELRYAKGTAKKFF